MLINLNTATKTAPFGGQILDEAGSLVAKGTSYALCSRPGETNTCRHTSRRTQFPGGGFEYAYVAPFHWIQNSWSRDTAIDAKDELMSQGSLGVFSMTA
jgi:hypothetical protein